MTRESQDPATEPERVWRPAFDPERYIIQIAGKNGQVIVDRYLPIAARVLWFRHEHPTGHIATDAVVRSEDEVWFTATVSWPEGGSATGWARQTPRDFANGWVEKAETKALGRALAALGYGTDACGDEFDETGEPGRAPRRAQLSRRRDPNQPRSAPTQREQSARPDIPPPGSERRVEQPRARNEAPGAALDPPHQFAAICRRLGLEEGGIRKAFSVPDSMKVSEWGAREGWEKVVEKAEDYARWRDEQAAPVEASAERIS